MANAAFIRELVQAELMKAPSAEWKRRLDEAGVPCSLIPEIPEALSQPQVRHRGLVRETIDEPSGSTMRTLNAPFQYAHDGPAPSFAPQRLGANNEDILTALGYNKAEIAELQKTRSDIETPRHSGERQNPCDGSTMDAGVRQR